MKNPAFVEIPLFGLFSTGLFIAIFEEVRAAGWNDMISWYFLDNFFFLKRAQTFINFRSHIEPYAGYYQQ
jgi:hypothetical protein